MKITIEAGGKELGDLARVLLSIGSGRTLSAERKARFLERVLPHSKDMPNWILGDPSGYCNELVKALVSAVEEDGQGDGASEQSRNSSE